MAFNISARVWIGFTLSIAIIGALSGWLYLNSKQSERLQYAYEHAREVHFIARNLLSEFKDAETSQRGFIITGNPDYLAPYQASLRRIILEQERLRALLRPEIEDRDHLDNLDKLIDQKLAELSETIEARRISGFEAARDSVVLNDGKSIMDGIRLIIDNIASRHDSLTMRYQEDAVALRNRVQWLLILGIPLAGLLLLFLSIQTIRRVRGQTDQFISKLQDELSYRERTDVELTESHRQLKKQSADQAEEARIIEILGRMAHRLQSCATEEEFVDVVHRYTPQALPSIPGALILMNNSRNLMRTVTTWNNPRTVTPDFYLEDCWALRRGQAHVVADIDDEIVCRHVDEKVTKGYVCIPLTAQSNVVGLLYLELQGPAAEQILEDRKFAILAENVALALVNHRLQEMLRVQSIRDSLTGLYNRRFLDETLEREFAAAERESRPIGVIMIDIDHFKIFNDTHGHDAGDAVLQAVGKLLSAKLRKGDLACRYGGEEFTYILLGSPLDKVVERAELLRKLASELTLVHREETVGPITLSLGVAIFPDHGVTPDNVVKAADTALLNAKRNGRNRVEIASHQPQASTPARATPEIEAVSG